MACSEVRHPAKGLECDASDPGSRIRLFEATISEVLGQDDH
jgi:hypothetical protein